MTHPIVHIGYHKTATSWFQKNFYPHVRNATYLNRKRVRDVFLNTTAFSFDPDKARQELQVDDRPIICEEDLCGHYDNGGLLESLSKDVAYRISAVYPDAQIVIFIRNQLDMIRSTYLQYVRGGGTWSLSRFLSPYARGSIYARRWYKKPMLSLDHFAYQHLIHHYQSVFGPSRVHVFCYEDFAADVPGFIERFAHRLDLDGPFDQLNHEPRNKSLGLVSLQLARFFGPFSRWDNPNRLILLPVIPMWMHKQGLKAFNKTPLAGPQLSNNRLFGKKLGRELHNRFVPDNQALTQELNLPLAEWAYPMVRLD